MSATCSCRTRPSLYLVWLSHCQMHYSAVQRHADQALDRLTCLCRNKLPFLYWCFAYPNEQKHIAYRTFLLLISLICLDGVCLECKKALRLIVQEPQFNFIAFVCFLLGCAVGPGVFLCMSTVTAGAVGGVGGCFRPSQLLQLPQRGPRPELWAASSSH